MSNFMTETLAFRATTATRLVIEAAACEKGQTYGEWLRECARRVALAELQADEAEA